MAAKVNSKKKRNRVRRDDEIFPAPASHARLGASAEVVRQNEQNLRARHFLARPLDTPGRLFDLLALGHECFAIFSRPTVKLDIGKLQPLGVQLPGQLNDLSRSV